MKSRAQIISKGKADDKKFRQRNEIVERPSTVETRASEAVLFALYIVRYGQISLTLIFVSNDLAPSIKSVLCD